MTIRILERKNVVTNKSHGNSSQKQSSPCLPRAEVHREFSQSLSRVWDMTQTDFEFSQDSETPHRINCPRIDLILLLNCPYKGCWSGGAPTGVSNLFKVKERWFSSQEVAEGNTRSLPVDRDVLRTRGYYLVLRRRSFTQGSDPYVKVVGVRDGTRRLPLGVFTRDRFLTPLFTTCNEGPRSIDAGDGVYGLDE